MGIEQIQPLVVADVVGGILAAMNAMVAKSQQDLVQSIRVMRFSEKVDVARGAHDLVCS